MKPETLRHALIEQLGGIFLADNQAYYEEFHGNFLLRCPLKGWLNKNSTPAVAGMIRMETGKAWDEKGKELLTAIFGPTKHESITYHGAVFHPDYTTSGFVVEIKFTEYLDTNVFGKKHIGTPYKHHIEQLGQYCAVTDIPHGYLWYITLGAYQEELDKFAPDFRVFEFIWTAEQLEEVRTLIKQEIKNVQFLWNQLDQLGTTSNEIKPKYNWECKYCEHTFTCKTIKNVETMPYEELREFPPTTKPLEKQGAVLEGILIETRHIERKVEGEPPRRSIVHEIKLVNPIQCLTEVSRGKWEKTKHPKDSHISVWGGRKGFDAKMELVEDGQQFRLTREAKIGAFIPFKLEVWTD